jgi:hypothetical protein
MSNAAQINDSAKRRSGGQLNNSNRVTHGGYRRRRALKEIDWTTQLDRRTGLYRELRERTERILAGAGGPAAVEPNRLRLAQYAAQVEVEIETLNLAIHSWGPIDPKRRKGRSIIDDRNRLLRTYRELLDIVGWDRAAQPRTTLAEVIASYAVRHGGVETEDAPDADGAVDGSGEP